MRELDRRQASECVRPPEHSYDTVVARVLTESIRPHGISGHQRFTIERT
jgi:hypothetical protein